ncbi:MAG: hypothetical protein AAFP13_12065 [Pseudomonadota bacterium]
MYPFYFACAWTLFTVFLAHATFHEAGDVERWLLVGFPVFGLVCMAVAWINARRWRTLRTEEEGGVTWYIWIDAGGRECRSDRDPRPDWEAEEADGDGDGGD